MTGRVLASLREAIHKTATGSGMPMKALAAELDWSPSELSHRTTLGGESLKPFPADDEHLIKIQKVTGDVSILMTMADQLGFEAPRPKQERAAEMMIEAKNEAMALLKKVQLALDLDIQQTKRRPR
jgi:hypothetical protein